MRLYRPTRTTVLRAAPLLAVALLIAVVLVRMDAKSAAATETASGEWPARGDERSDTRVVRGAVAAWDAQVHASHRDVRVLYAGRNEEVAAVVILEGTTATGSRLAVLTGTRKQPGGDGRPDSALHVQTDRAAPDLSRTREISLLTRQTFTPMTPGGPPAADPDGVLAIALAQSGLAAHFSSWAWDTYGGDASGELTVRTLPVSATLLNTTLTLTWHGHPIYRAAPDTQGRGDARGRRTGIASLGYLPSGVQPRGHAYTRSVHGARLTSQSFSGSGKRIEVTQVSAPHLTLQRIADLAAPATHTGPANPHDHSPMLEVIKPGTRGFAWQPRPGLGLIVQAVGGGHAEIDAYEVAQATAP